MVLFVGWREGGALVSSCWSFQNNYADTLRVQVGARALLQVNEFITFSIRGVIIIDIISHGVSVIARSTSQKQTQWQDIVNQKASYVRNKKRV